MGKQKTKTWIVALAVAWCVSAISLTGLYLPATAYAAQDDLATKITLTTTEATSSSSSSSSSSASTTLATTDTSSEASSSSSSSSGSSQPATTTTSSSSSSSSKVFDKSSSTSIPLLGEVENGKLLFGIGLAFIIAALLLSAYLLRDKLHKKALFSLSIGLIVGSSCLTMGMASGLSAYADSTTPSPVTASPTYAVTVTPSIDITNVKPGTVLKQTDVTIAISGTYDGTVVVTAGQANLTASASKEILRAAAKTPTKVSFTSDEIAKGVSKTIPVEITGTASTPKTTWSGSLAYTVTEKPDKPGTNPDPTIPEGVSGWYIPEGANNYVYVKDGKLTKGLVATEVAPTGATTDSQLYWLGDDGYLARNKAVQLSNTSYGFAKEDGTLIRGTYNDNAGHLWIADNGGNLAWGDKAEFVVADYGNGLQRYYIDPTTRAATVGFFTVPGYGKCYGLPDGYVLRGKMTYDALHVLVANNDGKLLSDEGWVVTAEFDGEFQRYRIDRVLTAPDGQSYYGAHTTLFTIDGSLYYGQPTVGYVARNQSFVANDGNSYRADNDGKLTLSPDWSLAVAPSGNAPDWGNDPAYTEQMRARAIANGGNQPYYITVDNRAEGGGRVIIFKHEGNAWIALAGWYANVGRWNASHTMTRSIAGIRPITDKIEQGTTAHNDPWVIPYFTDYLHWIDENGNDDGQGFHYTPNPNQQGNDMAGCTAFAAGRIEQAKWIWANVPLGCYVDVCGVACPDIATWENS